MASGLAMLIASISMGFSGINKEWRLYGPRQGR